MITETYVSFEIAKLLKEKGFDVRCRSGYWHDRNLCLQACSNSVDAPVYARPTQSVVMRWLREIHECPIEILWHFDEDSQVEEWYFWHHKELGQFPTIKYYSTYEQACEAAIKYCLENLV